MANFNFNELELALINAAKVAYKDVWFNMDGGYTYYEINKLITSSIDERIVSTMKEDSWIELKTQALDAYHEMLREGS